MLVDFYTILPPENPNEESTLTSFPATRMFQIQLNAEHPIYLGHFPGNPVVPGVCQVQIIKELVALTLGNEVHLTQSDNIKYLSMISPVETPRLTVKLEIKTTETPSWNVNATLSSEETVFIKFKGIFLSK
jgi:3-hydroxyacyl-[acyl-carrier-protein] dehydratase